MTEQTYILDVSTEQAIKNLQELGYSLDEAKKKVKEVQDAEKERQREETANAKKREQEQKKGLQDLDRMTGGYAQKFNQIKGSVKGAVSGLKTLWTSFKTGALSAVKSMISLKGAIAATGIGLLVIAVGTLVAYWDDIKNAVTGASSASRKQAEEAQKNVDAQQEALDAIGAQENILKLQGKSEKEIRDMKIAQTNEVIKASEATIEALKIKKKEELASYERQRAFVRLHFNS